MSFDVKYRLPASPEPTNNGSGYVIHRLQAVARETGSGAPFAQLPGYDRRIHVPAAGLATVLAMANGPAKVAAYKDLLVTSATTPPEYPARDWSLEGIAAAATANALAAQQAALATDYMLSLAGSFPADFAL